MKIREYINEIVSNPEFLNNSRIGLLNESGGELAFKYKMELFEQTNHCKLKSLEETSLIYAKKYLESDVMIKILEAYNITDKTLDGCNSLGEVEAVFMAMKAITPAIIVANKLGNYVRERILLIEQAAFMNSIEK